MLTPLARRVMSRILVLNRSMAFAAIVRLTSGPAVKLNRITPAQLRRYHLFLPVERRFAIGTVVMQICAAILWVVRLGDERCARTFSIRKSDSAYRSCAQHGRSPAPDCWRHNGINPCRACCR
jgi:hypothetical protein